MMEDEYLDQSLVFRKDTVVGLKLDPPEFKKPPRNKVAPVFSTTSAATGAGEKVECNSRNFIKHNGS